MERTPIIQQDDVPAVLEGYCLRSTPATVRPMADNTVFSAVFSSCSPTSVEFELQGELTCAFPGSGTCSVFFCNGAAAYHFMAPVLQEVESSQVVLALPNQIAVERRTSLRVPTNAGLCVEVKTPNGTAVNAQPRDFSLSGMFVEFARGADPVLPLNARISLELRLNHLRANLAGCIRRHVDSSYGIAFEHVDAARRMEPPNELRRIYTTLRQQKLTPNVVKTGGYRAGSVAIPVPKAT